MRRAKPLAGLAAMFIWAVAGSPTFALIEVGEGNAPIDDPGWPKGAAAVFNHGARVSWWEGPPFGGGQWTGEFRGDAKALNLALANFAKIDGDVKRLVVHDGIGRKAFSGIQEELKPEDRVDWTFAVWQPEHWKRMREMPPDLQPSNLVEFDSPPLIIHAYTGGRVKWTNVVVPNGIEVVDERQTAHGFTAADGAVFEGRIFDLADERPIAARIELQRLEQGNRPTVVQAVDADEEGRWLIKNAPVGWLQIVASADGYVPRIVAKVQLDGQAGWREYMSGLSRPGVVTGIVADESAQPIEGVEVRLIHVTGTDGKPYAMPEYAATTNAQGRFRIDQAPIGSARISLRKPGYCVDGLGRTTPTPGSVVLMMKRAAQLRVTVDFSKMQRPDEYVITIEPEGGSEVGRWGGSGQIDAANQITYSNVPPGRYVLRGLPNPARENEITKPQLVELRGGEEIDVTLDPMEREQR